VKTKVELGGVSGFSGNRSPFRDRDAESPNTATYGISTFRSTDMKKLLAPQFTVEMLHLHAGLHSTVEALFINEVAISGSRIRLHHIVKILLFAHC
jgi:hypothetical protein